MASQLTCPVCGALVTLTGSSRFRPHERGRRGISRPRIRALLPARCPASGSTPDEVARDALPMKAAS